MHDQTHFVKMHSKLLISRMPTAEKNHSSFPWIITKVIRDAARGGGAGGAGRRAEFKFRVTMVTRREL